MSWMPVFRQTMPSLWSPGVLSLNAEDETADNFAKLDTLESLRLSDGSLQFKMRWADPASSETNHWKQTSNPVTNAQSRISGVDGYEPVDVRQTINGFGGLDWNSGGESLLDGEPGSGNWFYALGLPQPWGQGGSIPSYAREAKVVELLAMDPQTAKWTLVFRQTMPHLWEVHGANPWSVNADDPYSDMYSILDQLEKFRGADGKFELKMQWPDTWNIWRQTSNPTQPGEVTGYSPIDVQHTGENFGGLEWHEDQGNTMIDGSIGSANWFYSIGVEADWQGKIPAFDGSGADQVELYVLVDKPAPVNV